MNIIEILLFQWVALVRFNQNMIIGGVVAANDQSGNIYKQIYIQDNTGGICISLNASELYTTYMVGQTVYIKCNGLSLGNYDSLPELGYNNAGAIGQIPQLSISSYLFLFWLPAESPLRQRLQLFRHSPDQK